MLSDAIRYFGCRALLMLLIFSDAFFTFSSSFSADFRAAPLMLFSFASLIAAAAAYAMLSNAMHGCHTPQC